MSNHSRRLACIGVYSALAPKWSPADKPMVRGDEIRAVERAIEWLEARDGVPLFIGSTPRNGQTACPGELARRDADDVAIIGR